MSNNIEKLQESMNDILAQALEAGRDKVVEIIRKRVKSGKDEQGSLFGSYGKSQSSRRNKEGLQTAYKDLHYSGTLFENFNEVSRNIGDTRGEMDISFKGAANRRTDQKGASNIQVAGWLTEQNKNKTIIGLSDSEKRTIVEAMKKAVGDEIQNITIT